MENPLMSSGFDRLRAEIERIPILNREEEAELCRKAQNGDGEAKRTLIAATLRHAIPIALALSRGKHARWEPGDLLGEAVKAMGGLVDRYDGRGSFSGFSKVRIRGAMKDFLRRRADLVRSNGNEVSFFSVDASNSEGDETWKDRLEADADDEEPEINLPKLTGQEKRVLAETILKTPTPGTIEDAARALSLEPSTVRRVLRAALAKRVA